MNECQRIESELWDYTKLPANKRAEIDRHLSSCDHCRQAAETIRLLGESSAEDTKWAASVNSQVFDREVMRRIAVEKTVAVTTGRENSATNWRMAVSFAMAAAVVLIMVKSVSDLDSINPVRMTSAPVTEEKRYGRINIELVPPEKIEEKAELKPQAMAESSEKLTPPIVAGETTTPAEAVMEAPVQLPPVQTAKFAARPGVMKDAGAPEQEETFSILPAPVTSPDSVNIDAIFVSNESIALNQQSYSASLSELYSDTMVAQSLHLQASRVVTIEKMPRPLRMEIPEYPVWAKKRGLSGTVWIKAKVNSDGKVTDAMVISCDMKAAGFEEAALEAAKHNLFVPASTNGMNLSVWVVYPVKFINKD